MSIDILSPQRFSAKKFALLLLKAFSITISESNGSTDFIFKAGNQTSVPH